MSSTSTGDADARLSVAKAADRLQLSIQYLHQLRFYGTGPLFEKVGGRVYYAVSDLDVWQKARLLKKEKRSKSSRQSRPKTSRRSSAAKTKRKGAKAPKRRSTPTRKAA